MDIYIFYTFITIVYSFSIILTSYFYLNYLITKFNWDKELSITLFLWHLFICMVYIFFETSQIFTTDSAYFFQFEKRQIIYSEFLNPGNKFMFEIINFIRILGFDFLSTTILFQSLGSISLVIFANCISKIYVNKKISLKTTKTYLSSGVPLILILFFFIPSLSYWSSTISKDTLTFVAISSLVFGITYKSLSAQLTCIVILLFTRPHILLLILLYYIILFSFNYLSNNFSKKKIFKYLIFIYFFSLLILNATVLLTNSDDQINYSFNLFYLIYDLYDFTFVFKNSYKETNLAINNSNQILSLFLYIFGPLNNINNHFVISNIWILENIIFILLLISTIKNFNIENLYSNLEKKIVLIISSFIILIFNSLIVNNYGIIFRQKWPYLLFLIYALNYLNFTQFKDFNNSGKKF